MHNDFIKNAKKINISLIVIEIASFSFAIFIMLYNLFHSALWGDEWCEWAFSQYSIRDGGLYNIIVQTYQPPLYNFIMHFWLKINDSLIWFRLFNLIPGFISLIALWHLTQILFENKKYCCLSIVLLSCCYQWIYYVQECAEYCLMVEFLFCVLLYFIRSIKYNRFYDNVSFLLFTVCAIYSQYGAVIISLPLIILQVFNILKKNGKKKIISLGCIYTVVGIVTGIPLYIYFFKIQTKHMNEVYRGISKLNLYELNNILFDFGTIIKWFFNIPNREFTNFIFKILGLVYIILVIYISWKYRKKDYVKSICLFVIIPVYVTHFLLVKMGIYGHGKFDERYSLFYLPVFIISLVIISDYLLKSQIVYLKRLHFVLAIMISLTIGNSFILILKNWDKAYDDLFIETWINCINNGYSRRINLTGYPSYPVNYYLKKGGYDCSEIVHDYTDIYIDADTELGSDFWLWSTGWSNNNYEMIIKQAKQRGYDIIEFYNYSEKGALSYCTLP